MATCKKIKRLEERVCIGSLNRKIIIYVRSITAPLADSVDYGENLSQPLTVWAMIETVNGVTTFDSSNIERIVTHNIYIRYRANITFENWLEVPRINEPVSQYYDIIRVENLDENYRFYKLICNLRGDTAKPVNLK